MLSRVSRGRVLTGWVLLPVLFVFTGCGKPDEKTASQGELSMEETRAIAKDAYIYGFPIVTN
jgi:hypothetical protein